MGKASDSGSSRGRGVQWGSVCDQDDAPVSRLEIIKQAAIRVMKRNFTPDERELDLNSWGLDDD